MSRAQRIFLAIALPVFAWLMHVNLCDWHYRESVSFRSRDGVANRSRIWTFDTYDANGVTSFTTGLATAERIDLKTALFGGVFLPLALVGLDVFFVLGFRTRRRRELALCLNCGFDLRGGGGATDRCPECGAACAPPAVK